MVFFPEATLGVQGAPKTGGLFPHPLPRLKNIHLPNIQVQAVNPFWKQTNKQTKKETKK